MLNRNRQTGTDLKLYFNPEFIIFDLTMFYCFINLRIKTVTDFVKSLLIKPMVLFDKKLMYE